MSQGWQQCSAGRRVAERVCRRPPPQRSTSTLAPSSSTARSARVSRLSTVHLVCFIFDPNCILFSSLVVVAIPLSGNHCAVHQPPRLGSTALDGPKRSAPRQAE
ncbi:hypothetical protein IG631_09426 [Alternaria alternata]|nr:hypothetical protein IG631_09426 [Alternaria alternata]